MNQRENLLALLRREPYEWTPAEFSLCPSLEEEYRKRTGGSLPYRDFFEMPWRNVPDLAVPEDAGRYLPYHPNLKPGSQIDLWGVAHEPGSAAAKHMTYLRSPLRGIDSLAGVRAYPPAGLSARGRVEAEGGRRRNPREGARRVRQYADDRLGNGMVHPRDGRPDDGHDER